MVETIEILKRAKALSYNAPLSSEIKNNGLKAMEKALLDNTDAILLANAKDVENAKGKVSDVMIDRLRLDKSRIEGMANGILEVAELPDPVGSSLEETKHKNGMIITKTSIPFGVVAIIMKADLMLRLTRRLLALKAEMFVC